MAFQLKNFVSIVASMINRAKATQSRLTDFEIGSVARTLMEAPAIEIEQFYQRMFAGIMDAIPVSIYRGFQFSVQDPVKARGTVHVAFGGPLDTDFDIPAGTIFINRTTTQRYLSVADVVAPAGATAVDLLVDAEKTGSAYNVGPGQVTIVANLKLPTGSSLTNDAILTGGDGETDAERAARFLKYIGSISRATVFSCEYAAGTAQITDSSGAVVEYVSRVGVDETPGYVKLYIYGSNQAPSVALVAAAQHILDGYFDTATQQFVPGYRPIGVDVVVLPMAQQQVALTASITTEPGTALADVSALVQSAMGGVINDVQAGEALYIDALRNAALSVPGVASCLVSLTANMTCPANIVFVPGTITVTEAA